MILLWGVPGDAQLDAVHAALARKQAPVRVLDPRHAAKMRATVAVDALGRMGGTVEDAAGCLNLGEVGATYIRPRETACPWETARGETARADGADPCDGADFQQAAAVDAALVAWADLTSSAVINRPAAMAVHHSKPLQLAQISDYGFAVPETLVTTDESAARDFITQHGAVMYKSVSGTRSVASRLTVEALDTLADVANCPTQFQQYIPGVDVRVHVAGDAVYATETASDAGRASMAIELPLGLAARCVAMARGMDLHLAGIDLRRTSARAWYCLAVNPAPAFASYESVTGQPVAAAVADLLCRLDRRGV